MTTNDPRHYDVIVAPLITEKATNASEHNKVLFKVAIDDAKCTATSYRPGAAGALTFGMGFSTDGAGPSETLYIAGGTTISPSARSMIS